MSFEPFNPARMKEDDGSDTTLSEEVYVRTERYHYARMLKHVMREVAVSGIVPPEVASGIHDIYQRGRREWYAASLLLGNDLEDDELAFLNGETDDV